MMEDKILKILKEVLEDTNVNPETSQENNENWDSMKHLYLVVELETAFGISLEPDEIAKMTSVATISEVISNKQV